MRQTPGFKIFLFLACFLPFSAKATNAEEQSSKITPILELAAKTRRTTIEFDEQKIKGVRRVPLGSLITEQRSKLKIELIMMRKAWKKKIINSTDWL